MGANELARRNSGHSVLGQSAVMLESDSGGRKSKSLRQMKLSVRLQELKLATARAANHAKATCEDGVEKNH